MNLPQAYWVRACNGSFGFKLKEEFLGVVLVEEQRQSRNLGAV